MSTRGTALVTGASSGIGLELARVFAREGFDLALTARRGDALAALATDLQTRHGVAVHVVTADLATAGGAAALADDLERAGIHVDVLVNNAGFGLFGNFADTPLDDELRMIQLNVASLVTLTKRCVPAMVARRRGWILHVASTAAFLPGPHMSVYYATKAFVLSFSEATADELRDSGVTVSVLCPGPTTSEFQQTARMERSRLMQQAMMGSAPVAEAGYRGLMTGTRVIVPGLSNRMVPVLTRLLPRRLVTFVSRRAAEVA